MNSIIKKAVWVTIAAPFAYLAIVWKKLPATIPVHFNLNGEADRYGSKKELLFMALIMAVVSLFVFFLFKNINRIDPKRYAAENNDRLQRLGFIITVFISALSCMIIYSTTSGGSAFSFKLILSCVGLLFAAIGNYMPGIKPNYFAGLRLPWTLDNENNWRKTHAMAGKYWFFGGLLLAIICLFIPLTVAIISLFVISTVIIIIPAVYSYRLFKKQKQEEE